jgi:CheY-like chemotaxis protein
MDAARILVVDDEETIRQALVRVLKRKGCVVLESGSAEGAVEAIAFHEPHVALLDIVLPGMNGVVSRALARREAVLMQRSSLEAQEHSKTIS